MTVANGACCAPCYPAFYSEGIDNIVLKLFKVDANTGNRVLRDCIDEATVFGILRESLDEFNNIYIGDGLDCRTEDITTIGSRRYGTTFYNCVDAKVVRGQSIDGNNFTNGIYSRANDRITIDGHTSRDNGRYIIYGTGANHITNSHFHNCGASIETPSNEDVTIADNEIDGHANAYGIACNGNLRCTIMGNNISHCGHAIDDVNGNITVVGNIMHDNDEAVGFYCTDPAVSKVRIISNNVIKDNHVGGIRIWNWFANPADNVLIEGNYIADNEAGGIIWATNAGGAISKGVQIIHNTFEAIVRQDYGIDILAGSLGNNYIHGNHFISSTIQHIRNASPYPIRPFVTETYHCHIGTDTISMLAASANGIYSAIEQPDLVGGRNFFIEKTGAAANGGTVTITGLDQFGNPVSEAHTFVGAAAFVMSKIFAKIDVNGITIAGLTPADKISVGLANNIGLNHKIFTGAVYKASWSAIGNNPAFAEDTVYYSINNNCNLSTGEVFTIQSSDCMT